METRVGLAVAAMFSVFVGCADIDSLDHSEQKGVATTITTNDATYGVGESIVVNFAGMSGSTTDWVTLARTTDTDTQFVAYQYTEGADPGTLTFSGLPAGSYEARVYFDWIGSESYVVHARSEAFTVSAGTAIATDAVQYAPGASVTVSYAGLPGTPTDWIGIAPPGSPDSAFIRYSYTSGAASGTVTFDSLPSGTWVARSYGNDSFDLVSESAPFAVGNIVSTSQSAYQQSDTITVSFSGLLPASPTNWIAVAPAGSPTSTFVQYQYVATSSGSVQFSPLAPGNYEARAFRNDSFELAGSAAFTVINPAPAVVTTSQPSYVEGAVVSVSYANTSGDPQDWIGIAVAGSPNTSYVRYAYVDNTGSVTFGGLAPGNYEARLYSDDTFNVVTSVAFTVTPAPNADPIDVTTSSPTYASGETVLVSFAGLGGPQDWIGVATAGSPDDTYITYVYTSGASGQVQFADLPPGSYEARAYRNDSFTVEDRATFTINP